MRPSGGAVVALGATASLFVGAGCGKADQASDSPRTTTTLTVEEIESRVQELAEARGIEGLRFYPVNELAIEAACQDDQVADRIRFTANLNDVTDEAPPSDAG